MRSFKQHLKEEARLSIASFDDNSNNGIGAHLIPADFWGLGSELESFFGAGHPGGTMLDKAAYLIHQYWDLPVPPAPSAMDFNNDGVVDGGDLGVALQMFGHYGSELDWDLFDTPWT